MYRISLLGAENHKQDNHLDKYSSGRITMVIKDTNICFSNDDHAQIIRGNLP